jgi:O-antigen ligase
VTNFVVDYAHNDYLQFGVEAGITGWIAAVISLFIFVGAVRDRMRNDLGDPIIMLQLGAALGVVGILVHSALDFNLHIPANAAWFAVCVGLATIPHKAQESYIKEGRADWPRIECAASLK